MVYCIKEAKICIGRGCQELSEFANIEICCKEELHDEKEIVQNVLDCIEDRTPTQDSLVRITSRLSYASSVLNADQNIDFIEIFPMVRRFSSLVYTKKEEILEDPILSELTCSFVQEIKGWFTYNFLNEVYPYQLPIQKQSLLADINTIELALGSCAIEYSDDSLDDLFF